MNITDNLYAYVWRGRDNNCNSYVFAHVLTDGRHAIVDPGHIVTPYFQEPALERLSEGMARDGIADAGVGLIILTHAHPDHCEAAVAFREQGRSLVALHEADEPNYRMMGGKVDIFLENGTLELGKEKTAKLQIFHTPGHTPGHIAIYWPERKVLIAGDCIFYRSIGRTDFPGGDARALQKSIAVLSELDVEYLLCGHPYGNSGIIRGREAVRDNFKFIKNFFE